MDKPQVLWRGRMLGALAAMWQPPREDSGSTVRVIQLFSTSVIDQVLLSAANFFVGLMLIRHTKDYDYGLFVLVQSTIILVVSTQGAWISGPLSALAPKRAAAQRREMVGAIEGSQRRIVYRMAIASMIVPLVGYLLGLCNQLVAMVIAVGILACAAALQREYLRSVLLIYSRPNSMLQADIVYVVVLVLGTLVAAFGPRPAVAWAVGALVAAALAGAFAAKRSLAKDPGWVSGNATPFWRELRPLGTWAVVGSVIYWSFGQSYNYMLATRLDLKAVADVNEARLLLMPVFVVTLGIRSLLTPSAATWLAESGLSQLIKRLGIFVVGVVVLDIGYFGFVWLFRDALTNDVLHKVVHDRDVLLILWATIALISLVRDVFLCALSALECFKPMAWLTGACAIVALLLMWFGLGWWGARAVLIGQISGEIMSLIGVLVLLRRQFLIYSGG